MTTLRGRELHLQIDTIKIDILPDTPAALKCTFKATKTLKPEPNTCEVQIYNLNPDHRNALSKAKLPVLALTAGYPGELTQIFLGQMIHVSHERRDRDRDVVTTISTTDGGEAKSRSRVNVSFGSGTKIDQVLRTLANALGVKPGNLSAVSNQLARSLKANLYLEGVTLAGNAGHAMTQLVRSAGLEWSIQDGALQLLNRGEASARFATLLDESILLNTPSVDAKGVVSGRTLIQRDFLPGRMIQISHEFVRGNFRLEKCDYSGDTSSDEWAIDFEAKGKRT